MRIRILIGTTVVRIASPDSHGDFTYTNSSLPNPTTPNPTHSYPDLPYHIISTPTRPYSGDFGDSHGDFGGDFGFSGDPSRTVLQNLGLVGCVEA